NIVDRKATFRTGYKFQNKGYQIESRLITGGETRSDKRHTASASIEIPIVKGFNAKAEIEYIASNSNYSPVDYNETITTFGVSWVY
ncbi:MAG: hypothetical protein P8I94_04825, partial [Emcibacteraceae bacterium]|nr:hypothetical protein [Emcibacteraceae bacterium]